MSRRTPRSRLRADAHGVLIQEGRAARARAEVFAPLSPWFGPVTALRSARNIAERKLARGRSRHAKRTLRNPKNRGSRKRGPRCRVHNEGRKFLSIEFHALKETPKQAAGVREITTGLSFPARPLFRVLSIRTGDAPKSGRAVVGENTGCEVAFLSCSAATGRKCASSSYTDLVVSRLDRSPAVLARRETARRSGR